LISQKDETNANIPTVYIYYGHSKYLFEFGTKVVFVTRLSAVFYRN